MPVDPITSAIVSSVIGAALERALTPTPPPPMSGVVRELPLEAQIGLMFPPDKGVVRIGNRFYLLAPGAQVRDDMNMLVFADHIQVPVRVRFLTDYTGAVQRIWILSSAEAALPENR